MKNKKHQTNKSIFLLSFQIKFIELLFIYSFLSKCFFSKEKYDGSLESHTLKIMYFLYFKVNVKRLLCGITLMTFHN